MIAPTLPNPVIPVGVDDGYHQTKVVLGNGVTLSIPSTARLGRPDVLSLGRDGQADVQEYETEEVRYSAGRIEGEDTVFNEYPHSPLNRVIVHHALRMAGLSGKPVNLVTGLPVDSYFLKGRQAGPNKTLIERKIASLAVPVTPCDDTAPVEVRYHMVLAEGLAAYFDYVVDVDAAGVVSRNRVREKEQVAIIDIGGRTSDYAVIDGGRGIKLDESGSMEALYPQATAPVAA
jgi:plasmid segregation protein ParM